jgi:Rrf2 family transcriptional regulator, cysteine metabolism repressor
MTFTAKEDYGLRAILDIAANGGSGPVQAREIAQRQRIPEQFLEQLLATLRRAELIRSIRGAGGGYALAMDANTLRVGDVLRALSGPLVPHDLSTPGPDDSPETAAVRGIWDTFRIALRTVADETTLAVLLERRPQSANASYAMHI